MKILNEKTMVGERIQTDMHVLIVGAGIGGLTAALSLEKVGIEVTVFESIETIELLVWGLISCPTLPGS